MKKIILTFLIMLTLSTGIAAASYPSSVDVSPSSISKSVGSTFNVDIKINNVANLTVFSLKFNWNSNVLQLVNVSAKPYNLWPNYLKFKDEYSPNEYNITCVALAPSPSFSGSAVVASLTFKVKATGSSALRLKDTELVNSDIEYILHDVNSGNFTGVYGYFRSRIWRAPIPLDVTSVAAIVVVIAIAAIVMIFIGFKFFARKK